MKKPVTRIATCLFLTLLLSLSESTPPTVCIIGSGIGGSSAAYHLRRYGASSIGHIRMFERRGVVGGRMATVSIGGHTFEAGASVLHPKNHHAVEFAKSLNLTVKKPSSSGSNSLGIWNGRGFVFKTLRSNSEFWMVRKFVSFVDSVRMFLRYGVSLLRMANFVERTVDKFLKYYESLERRPVFESVEEMLKWSGLYTLTTRSLEKELLQIGLSPLLIQELVTVITRINYGQSVEMSGLAGAVSLAGSGGGLWSIEGGNWQLAAGLINQSNVALHLNEEIKSVSKNAGFYELNSTSGQSYKCEIVVISTPLDELDIQFRPSIIVPERKLQHTFTTFVKGCLNPIYFGLKKVSDIPDLIGTTETSSVPFSSIGTLWKHSEKDMTYKVFSRQPMSEELLDEIFSVRNKTIRINWAAYPQYHAPERFAPLILDQAHLYYVNAFENAASTIETSAVSAENVARLILSRLSHHPIPFVSDLENLDNHEYELRSDL